MADEIEKKNLTAQDIRDMAGDQSIVLMKWCTYEPWNDEDEQAVDKLKKSTTITDDDSDLFEITTEYVNIVIEEKNEDAIEAIKETIGNELFEELQTNKIDVVFYCVE